MRMLTDIVILSGYYFMFS